MTLFFFFFNDTATTEIYTLSLHDALPICSARHLLQVVSVAVQGSGSRRPGRLTGGWYSKSGCCCYQPPVRSEEHTSELQSQSNLVCRLLLEKKKKRKFSYSGD